jgi:hypothetical protein
MNGIGFDSSGGRHRSAQRDRTRCPTVVSSRCARWLTSSLLILRDSARPGGRCTVDWYGHQADTQDVESAPGDALVDALVPAYDRAHRSSGVAKAARASCALAGPPVTAEAVVHGPPVRSVSKGGVNENDRCLGHETSFRVEGEGRLRVLAVPRSPWFPWSDARAVARRGPVPQARAFHPGSPGRDGVPESPMWSYDGKPSAPSRT